MDRHFLTFLSRNPILTLGSGIVVFSFLLIILAMSGVFSPAVITPLLALFLASSLFSLFSFWRSIPWKERLGLICITILTIGIVSFSHIEPTVFTGRDQGSIATAAIELAKNHRLDFTLPIATDFFAIYGVGEALNFPGFFYTPNGSLITKFPLGYTVFLASFFQSFGLIGFMIGNSILLGISMLVLYALLRKLAPSMTWFSLAIFSSSLIPAFLIHLTLTENFALFLFLFLSLQLTEFFQTRSTAHYFGVLLPVLFFPFVRVEGFAILGMTILALALRGEVRQFIRERLLERCVLPTILFTLLLIATFIGNNPFYRVMGKEILKSLPLDAATGTSVSFLALPSILSLYGMLSVIIAGGIGILFLLRSKRWILLIPAFLALPTLIYLLSPSITPDHPWMLRRFLFSVWPALLLSFLFIVGMLLEQKKLRKGVAYILPTLLLVGQLPALLSFISPKTDMPLLSQTASFASHFSPTDRILIDREVTGDGFTMISGPLASLHDINAVYFFNPLDMKKLPTHEGQTTYLLVPEEKISFYEESMPEYALIPKQSMDFSLIRRETVPASNAHFPQSISHKKRDILLLVTPQ